VKSSRDLALIIVFAVLNLVLVIMIGQLPELITGIPAIGYVFIIFYAITGSVALLMYEGRRWRLFMQSLLFSSIAVITIRIWTPTAAIVTILTAFIIDVGFNSCYGFFKRKNKLHWWVILSQLYSWTTQPIWTMLFVALFIAPFEAVLRTWFIPIILVMLPAIIIQAIAGGYIGYKIYRRVEKLA
jgi:hypothetical protein